MAIAFRVFGLAATVIVISACSSHQTMLGKQSLPGVTTATPNQYKSHGGDYRFIIRNKTSETLRIDTGFTDCMITNLPFPVVVNAGHTFEAQIETKASGRCAVDSSIFTTVYRVPG